MSKTTRRVGRFQLSAKGRKGRKDAFRRSDKLINVRPSSSGAGRKLTKKQKIRAGLEKKAQDPNEYMNNMRWIQYGLPALAGTALGGLMGGSRLGILGALLGAGAGHYLLTPGRQTQIQRSIANFLGTGADTGVGSSAEPPAPAPTRLNPSQVDAMIDQEAIELIREGADPETAYRTATDDVYKQMYVGDASAMADGQIYGKGSALEAAKARYSQTPENVKRVLLSPRWEKDIEAMSKGYSPWAGVLAGTPLWLAEGTRQAARGVRQGQRFMPAVNAALVGSELKKTVGGARTGLQAAREAAHLGRLGKARAALGALWGGQAMKPFGGVAFGSMPTFLKSLPGEVMKWQTAMDLGRIGLTGWNAPTIDPNAPWYQRLLQGTRYGGEVFGESTLRDLYDPRSRKGRLGKLWQGGASMAAAPIAAAVAQGDAARATNLAKRRAAARGLYQRSPQTGEYLQGDRAAKYQRSLINKASLGSKPIEWIRNPIGAQYNALRNAVNWWTR